MGIDKLQKGGNTFRMSHGAGNFKQQFNRQTLHGELQNLRDNQKSILEVVDQYKGYIRRDVMGRKLQKQAYRKIVKKEGAKLTYGDKKDIKKVLKHFSEKSSVENEPKVVPTINRAKAEDPNNAGPDSLVKKIGTRFVMKKESNSQDIRNKRIIQINSNSLVVKASDNPADDRVARLANKERINPRSFNVQSNDDKINSQSVNIEKAESLVVSQPTNIQMSDNKINSRSFNARNENLPISSSLNIQKSDEDYRALGLIKRKRINPRSFSVQSNDDQIISQRGNIERAEIPVTPKPAINIEKDEVPVAPLFTPEPPKIERKESPVIPQSIKVEKKEKKITPEPIKVEKKEVKKEEIPVTPKPAINIEKDEVPVAPLFTPEPPKIERKESPVIPQSIKVEKKEKKITPEPIKVEKKEVKKEEIPVTPKSVNAENIEVKKVEIKKEENKKEENKTEGNKTEENKTEENKTEENKTEENKKEENKKEENKKEENKKEETPITKPIIYIQRAENPIAPESAKSKKKEKPIASEPAKSKKKEKPIVPQFANPINFEKKINIQKAETPINQDTPNIADLKEPSPDNISPSKEEVQANRGDAVRAKINYEHALNLGGSEAAQDIQKKAFEEMNNIDNSSNN